MSNYSTAALRSHEVTDQAQLEMLWSDDHQNAFAILDVAYRSAISGHNEVNGMLEGFELTDNGRTIAHFGQTTAYKTGSRQEATSGSQQNAQDQNDIYSISNFHKFLKRI